jgi:hypothetical protein
LETFETWLPLDNFDNAKLIGRQWVEMFLKKCASEIEKVREKGRRGNKQLVTDLGEHTRTTERNNLPNLPNTMFMVVIGWLSNGNSIVLSPNPLQAVYTDVR